ncbi:MAG: CoA transferase [Burkholderiales bacterium]|nr:CoA transferase [Burkholderiales bacterium]
MTRPTPSYERPYAGLTVLDLSQGIAGPYCAMLLAQYGATVIKVEPFAGDWGRALGKRVGAHSALDLTANRGKRSLALDLRQAAGRDLLARLAARADVVIENFRPGVVDRLGVGYAAVSATNPRVLYLSVSAFGQTGPAREKPGSDTVAQAFSGMMAANRDAAGKPQHTGFLAADYGTAMYAFQALAAALMARPHEARGRHIDVSLVHAVGAFLAMKFIEERLEGGPAPKLNAPAGSYRTQDGWMAVTLTKEAHFPALCRAIGRPELAADPRFADFALRSANLAALAPLLQETLATRTTAEWLAIFEEADVLASRIHDFSSWLDDPQVRAVGLVAEAAPPGLPPVPWVRVPGALHPPPGDARLAWPEVGEHSAQILAEQLGIDEATIAQLRRDGVLPP